MLTDKARDALDELKAMMGEKDEAKVIEQAIIGRSLIEMAKHGIVRMEVEEFEGGHHLHFGHKDDWDHEGPIHDSIPDPDAVPVTERPLPPKGSEERIDALVDHWGD